jgi:hypothetical protein
MTSPESPAVQDTDRLREVAAEAEALRRNGPASDGRGWYRTAADRVECFAIADAVLAAVLPVHREMVLGEAAQSIIDHMDEHFPADGNDAQRRARRHLRIAVQVVSPKPTREQLAEKLVEMGVLRRVDDDPWEVRAAATGGGPCPGCGRPYWTHVCLSCSPDSQTPGYGCINCRQTGMDQTPCKPVPAPPTPPGSPPADERATAVETGRAGRFEELLAAEHEQFDPRGEVLRSITEYADAPTLAVSSPPAAVPGTGDDPGPAWKVTHWHCGCCDRGWELTRKGTWYSPFGDQPIDGFADAMCPSLDELRAKHPNLTPMEADNVPALLAERDALQLRAFAAEDKLELVLVNRAEVVDARDRLAETIRKVRELADATRTAFAESQHQHAIVPVVALAELDAALGDIPSPTAPEAGAMDDVLAALRDEADHRKQLAEYVAQRFAPVDPEGTPHA